MKIKVCGMRDPDNIRAVEALKVDWIGLIFHPLSPRYVATPPRYLPTTARRVGVFVDTSDATIAQTASLYGLQTIQFHGSESPERCHRWQQRGFEVIRAIGVGTEADMRRTESYIGACDYLLFDTQTVGHGGSGRRFDWRLLDSYHGSTPFLLSGGLSPDSLEALRAFRHPAFAGVDLNSGFETAPALKNLDTLYPFVNELKNIIP